MGINLLIFFGLLYLLRGLAVLTSFSRRRSLLLLTFSASVVLFPWVWPLTLLLSSAALLLGFTDTWLDWRQRRSTA